MSSKEDILKRLEKNSVSGKLPPAWKPANTADGLPQKFSSALTAVKGEVFLVENATQAVETVRELLSQLSVSNVVVTEDIAELLAPLKEPTWYVVGESEGDLREFCKSADVGLTGVEAALAETGSIVVRSGPGTSRAASLLPPVHIALVPISKVYPSIFEWKDSLSGEFPSQIVIISGPSKTADIEQTLSVGVHGPKRFIAVLYEDQSVGRL